MSQWALFWLLCTLSTALTVVGGARGEAAEQTHSFDIKFDIKGAPGQRAVQPNAKELLQAEKVLDEVFGREIVKAKSSTEKGKLAKEILEAVRDEQDLAVKFAGLQIARRLAIEALDGKLGLEIVREIVQNFEPAEEIPATDRLTEGDRLWLSAEKAQGRDRLSKQLEAIECWLYSDIKTGLVAKKWELRVQQLQSASALITLDWKNALLRGQHLKYDTRQDSISGWCYPQEYIEWPVDLAARSYDVALLYSSRGNAGGYLMAISLFTTTNYYQPLMTLHTELISTGGWNIYAEKSFGIIKVPRPGRYILRVHAIRRLGPDFEPCLVNVRAVFLR
ncbi:hypothetical protein [Thermogutta sp.]|uniref:hypothetical protein n=1 Tax=Thermogutta sp. TaxID=1962930 RepID=UPI003220381D